MAIRFLGPSYVIAGIAAFSNTGAIQLGAGAQVRVSNRGASLAWFAVCATQAEANAATIPAAGSPQGAYSLAPGESLIINNPNANNNGGAWVNACTTTDLTGFVTFDCGSGYGN